MLVNAVHVWFSPLSLPALSTSKPSNDKETVLCSLCSIQTRYNKRVQILMTQTSIMRPTSSFWMKISLMRGSTRLNSLPAVRPSPSPCLTLSPALPSTVLAVSTSLRKWSTHLAPVPPVTGPAKGWLHHWEILNMQEDIRWALQSPAGGKFHLSCDLPPAS